MRQVFEVLPGRFMEFELFLPPQYDPSKPKPFVVSVSGCGQTHINGFSQRLPCNDWVVAVPLRPDDAPCLFEGNGTEGDGVWHLYAFCRHLQRKFNVDGDRFLMVGVSNGGSSVLRFATIWPELCRGLLVVTGSLSASNEEMRRLQGLPVDMYVGTDDECGFYAAMVEIEDRLRSLNHSPAPSLTIFDRAGHVVSPLVERDLFMGKLRLMLLHSGSAGSTVLRPTEEHAFSSGTKRRLSAFASSLGLESELSARGELLVHAKSSKPQLPPVQKLTLGIGREESNQLQRFTNLSSASPQHWASQQSPQSTPQHTPQHTPYCTPLQTPQSTPLHTPQSTPSHTPQGTPERPPFFPASLPQHPPQQGRQPTPQPTPQRAPPQAPQHAAPAPQHLGSRTSRSPKPQPRLSFLPSKGRACSGSFPEGGVQPTLGSAHSAVLPPVSLLPPHGSCSGSFTSGSTHATTTSSHPQASPQTNWASPACSPQALTGHSGCAGGSYTATATGTARTPWSSPLACSPFGSPPALSPAPECAPTLLGRFGPFYCAEKPQTARTTRSSNLDLARSTTCKF